MGSLPTAASLWLSDEFSQDGLSAQIWVHTEIARIHSAKLTWNLKRGPSKGIAIYKGAIFGFHVSVLECRRIPNIFSFSLGASVSSPQL